MPRLFPSELNINTSSATLKILNSLSINIYGNFEMASADSVTNFIVACRDGLGLWGPTLQNAGG